ncbi:uncharacterized protein BDW70DRAFT_154140 [Aspergillus foveolatus]|uniref:uncharacterized protein n=1 Tax=Aspergillus foveolatus TaxID=210207 RepID=UPI003CCCC4A2
MPGRRPHTKSRAGCQRCKEKHVKCDEVRPTCGACARYGVPCVPKPLTTVRRGEKRGNQPSASPGLTGLPATPASPAPSLLVPSRERATLSLWEFELVHHWILHVAESFQVSPGFQRAWCDRGIRVAIQYDFFLHMILMLSALHLALTKSPSFMEAHRAFILEGCSDATTSFRKEAENINDSNSHAVQAFPFLMSIYALALPQFDREEKGGEAVLDEMIHILIVIKGNSLVRPTATPWPRARMSPRWMEEKDFLDQIDEDNRDKDLSNALGTLQPWVDSSNDDPRVRSVNSETIELFRETLKVHLKRSLRPLSWPNAVQNDYIDLLRQRNPMALVVLAHYAVILGQCSDQWWCSNWGVRLLSVIAAMLPEEYQGAIAYPLHMLSPENGQ